MLSEKNGIILANVIPESKNRLGNMTGRFHLLLVVGFHRQVLGHLKNDANVPLIDIYLLDCLAMQSERRRNG